MPSPFPGMDPYLEDPGLWPDVHHELISAARAVLTERLRPKYFVRVDLRVYISDEEDPGRRVLVPDLRVAESEPGSAVSMRARSTAGVGIAEPTIITKLIDEEINEAYLEVTDRESRQVVTFVEIVSPSNKVSGSEGRASYLRKRRQVMDSTSHWMEIDLLRTGAPLISRELLSKGEYCVHVSRAGKRPESETWPIRLQDRLPVVPVPLKPEDGAVELDLQQLLDETYDRAGYDLTINYRLQPEVPLTVEQNAWADQLLKAKGLR